MVPWKLVASGVALVVFPQHKGAVLVASAVLNIIKLGGNGDRKDKKDEEEISTSGKVKPIRLEWKDIECALVKKKKVLLKKLNGVAQPGRLLAIMGPSGSGKTTLLNTLAGQVPKSDAVSLMGELYVNGLPASSANYRQAYVRQEDIFFSQLTVRETLLMAGKLQLPATMTATEQEAYVDELIQRLGLLKAANTIVGDARARGISGGEKKRLSIACELISRPSIIFADEPTTGLDAFQAERVMKTLRDLAQEGHTIVCSIHQPRGSIYAMFDDLMLLADGEVVYAGAAGEEAISYFSELGHECPVHCNPAEFFSDLISTDFSSPETIEETHARVAALIAKFRDRQRSQVLVMEEGMDGSGGPAEAGTAGSSAVVKRRQRAGWISQFLILLRRSWRQTTRDKATNFVRAAMNISSALIFGSIFWRMGFGQSTIQDRMGLLQVVAINTAMSSLTKTVNVFPREKLIVHREWAKRSYDITPYFFAKLAAELPIGAFFPMLFGALVYPMTGLHRKISRFAKFVGIITLESFVSAAMGLTVGAIAPSSEAGMALGPAIMTIFIVFGGYYVNPDNTPKIFRWLPNISLIRWGFQALTINEFKGLEFEATRKADAALGEEVLERLSFADTSIRHAMLMECKILVGLYYLTYYLLRARGPKFQKVMPPQVKELEGATSAPSVGGKVAEGSE